MIVLCRLWVLCRMIGSVFMVFVLHVLFTNFGFSSIQYPGAEKPEYSKPVSVCSYQLVFCSSRFIQTMSDSLSEVAQARAWIHLALEKKMLSQHLKELLTHQELLRSEFIDEFAIEQQAQILLMHFICRLSDRVFVLLCSTNRQMYKPHAFLLCEEEREQFLFHLLSLNTVDYLCFTRVFTSVCE